MKRVGKSVFFIVSIFIVLLTVVSFTGLSTTYGDKTVTYVKGGNDIRWGIDIRGGVDVTFTPPAGIDATDEQMNAARAVIEQRLVNLHITDNEVYVDYNKDRVLVRFPWKEGESNYDPETAIKELGETALLTFREGYELNSDGTPAGITASNVILNGEDIKSATAGYYQDQMSGNPSSYVVSLELNDSGKAKFAEATTRLAATKGVISIWMDDTMISYPQVNDPITDGQAQITGNFDAKEAQALADKINSGALPFKLETQDFNTIDPTLGMGARDVMIMAGIIAFLLVALYVFLYYRLPGAVAVISLLGQVAGSIAAVTGFLPFIASFTLTLPGIAGIILSIGMGVDANIISAARIKEEINSGKSVDGAISAGYERAFTAIFDGNLTLIIIAIVLMAAFGPSDGIFTRILGFLFAGFGQSTAGAIYSFGYTLLIGSIMNFIFGVTASKLMLKSISKFKAFRKPWFYGGEK